MNTAILNVLLQFVEGLISFEFYESIAPTKKKLRNFALITVGYMIMCGINLAFDYNVVVNTIVLTVFQFLFLHFLYKLKSVFSIFYSILFTCLVSVTEFIVLEVDAIILGGSSRDFINDAASYIILIILSKSLLFVFLKIISFIINKFRSIEKAYITSLIYPFSLLIVVTIFGLVSYYGNPSDRLRLIIAISTMLLSILVIGTCILQQKQSQNETELVELRAIKQAQETDNKYFEILERQNNNLMVYAHDTKNHLQAIRNMTYDENIIEYLERLTADLKKYSRHASSGNHNLDVIINKYITECEIKGVSFDYDVRLSNLSGVQMFDLVSILGNLLDNALESAEKSEEKSIHLQTDHRNTYDVIVVTNSCDTKPVTQGNSLKSSKANKKQHGLGIKSIKSALKNYDGDYNWEYDEQNKEFISTVMILRK
ncbi:MAG: GHKL domain-containing protein [Clostridia bacterium]|nr:GHKL domain-containing protein [Clostridia bacterium]